MAEISLEKAGGATGQIVKTLGDSTNYLKDGLALFQEINKTLSHLKPVIDRFIPNQGGMGGGDAIISNPPADYKYQQQHPPTKTGGSPPAQQFDPQKYFSTPEGIKQIIQAIDQFSPIVGEDATLKDVKGLLKTGLEVINAKKPEQKKEGDRKNNSKKIPGNKQIAS